MKKIVPIGIVTLAAVLLPLRASAAADDAKDLYKKECAKCHGEDGKGDTRMGKRLGAKDYTDPAVQKAATDEEMAKAITEGLEVDGKRKMKAMKDLKEQEVKDLVAYMRAFAKK